MSSMVDQITFKRMFPDFSPREFECPCKHPLCQVDGMDFGFLFALQELRRQVAMPLIINSGYRCSTYNAALKGSAPKSRHIEGIAADIATHRLLATQKHVLLSKIFQRFSGVGIYRTFIHVDIRPVAESSVWVG